MVQTTAGLRLFLARFTTLLAELAAPITFGIIVLGVMAAQISTVDLAYLIRTGNIILDTRAIPSVDTFTFTAAGSPWLNQQWGAEVLFAATYRVGGWVALSLLRTLLTVTIFGVFYAAVRRRAPHLPKSLTAGLILLAFLVTSPGLAMRAQLMGMAFFALALTLLADRDTHPRRLWFIPLLAIGWGNVHGSFILLPVLLGLVWLEEIERRTGRARQVLEVAALSILAICITPLGPRVWVYALSLSTNETVSRLITEWAPASPHTRDGFLLFASIAAAAAFLARLERRPPWSTLAALGLFAGLAIWAIRGLSWWPMVAVFFLAPLMAPPRWRITSANPRLPERFYRIVRTAILACVAIFVAGTALLPIWRGNPRPDVPTRNVSEAPLGITRALGQVTARDERIWNFQPWGSWFELALPDRLVGFDSRVEIIPAAAWRDYIAVQNMEGDWRAILDRWGVTTIVTSKSQDGSLDTALGDDGRWQLLYADADGSIWVRARPQPLTARAGVLP